MNRSAFLILFIAAILSGYRELPAQKAKVSFRDSLDGAVDLSDWVIEAHGFIPVIMPITEPAVGFGAALAPVFLTPKKISPGEAAADKSLAFVPPDITLGFGAYTANGTWAAGAGRIGTFLKHRLRYRALGGYTDGNLNFYFDLPLAGERKFEFNIKAVLAHFSLLRQIGRTPFHAGLQYSFAGTTLSLPGGQLPDFITDKEKKNVTSVLGAVLEYDNRDNSFTPNKGGRVHFHANWSNRVLGSDFNYVKLNLFTAWYLQAAASWVAGLRLESSAVFGEVPFYLEPFISLRGVPAARYQGAYLLVLETEQRIRVYRRWSAVAFGGLGRTFPREEEREDRPLVYNFGGGFRYLIARKFNLHMGADVARGPEDWAFYIIFGSNWNR